MSKPEEFLDELQNFNHPTPLCNDIPNVVRYPYGDYFTQLTWQVKNLDLLVKHRSPGI
jgi:hypothetical protein